MVIAIRNFKRFLCYVSVHEHRSPYLEVEWIKRKTVQEFDVLAGASKREGENAVARAPTL